MIDRRAWQTASSAAARYHVVALTILATVMMWPASGFGPTPGLDPGWTTGLALARQDGLHFGSEVVFNYGPLGFALFPTVFNRRTLVLCIVAIAFLCGVYAVLTYRLLRARIAHPVGVAAATLVLIALAPSTGAAYCDVVAIVVLLTMFDLTRRVASPHPAWAPLLGGVVTFLMLTKVSTGVITALSFVVFAVAHEGRLRRLAVGCGVATGSFVVLWLALGQRIPDIWTWLRAVQQISTGHSWAMAAEEAGRGWETATAAALATTLAVVAVLALVRRRRAGLPLRTARSASAAALGALTFYFSFKEGFVRHDIHSGIFFFAVMYAVATITPWRMSSDRPPNGDLVRPGSRRSNGQLAMASCWLLSLLALNASGRISMTTALDPQPSATAFASTVDALVDSDGWRAAQADNRAALQAAYAVPDVVLAELRDHDVHVDPYDPAPIWAYGLRWDPPPVFTRYSAYTVALDRRNAAALVSAHGPDRVLRSNAPTLDGHLPLLESPQYSVALICGFGQAAASDAWQVLSRTPYRCGPVEQLASVDARPGQAVPVPTVDPSTQMLLVRVDFRPTVADGIRTLLYKADEYHLDIDAERFRITPLVVAEPGPLFVPSTAGWSAPFLPLAMPPTELRLDHAAAVTFSVVDVAPASGQLVDGVPTT